MTLKQEDEKWKEEEEEILSSDTLEKIGKIAFFCSKFSFLLTEWELVTASLEEQRNKILHRVEVKTQETNAKKEEMELKMKEWIDLEKRVHSLQEEEKNLLFGIEILKRKTEKLEKKKIDFEFLLKELKKELGGIASAKKNSGEEKKETPPKEEESYADIYEENVDDEYEDED